MTPSPIRILCILSTVAACDKREAAPLEPPKQAPAPATVAKQPPPPPPRPVEPDATPAEPGSELVIQPSTPKPGASSIVTFEAALDFDLNFGGLEQTTSTKQSKRKKVQIVAVDPDGTVHKRITYIKRDTNMVVDGERKKDPSPIRGKAFAVVLRDGVIEVRRADGKPATQDEAAAVRAEEGQLQAPEALGRALVGMRLVEGRPFEVPIAALLPMISGDLKPRRVVLTYRGMDGANARIDADAVLVSDGAGTKLFLELKAEMLLDPTGWCLFTKATGQVRAELNGAVVGSGEGTGTVTATPLR